VKQEPEVEVGTGVLGGNFLGVLIGRLGATIVEEVPADHSQQEPSVGMTGDPRLFKRDLQMQLGASKVAVAECEAGHVEVGFWFVRCPVNCGTKCFECDRLLPAGEGEEAGCHLEPGPVRPFWDQTSSPADGIFGQ